MAKKIFLGANWKMNEPPIGCFSEGSPYRSIANVEVCVFLPSIEWYGAHAANLLYGAQCGRPEASGAFTGDISMLMLKNQHFHAVLCGHSERRQYHGETDENIAEQIFAAIKVGLLPILCIGEKAEERAVGKTNDVLMRQLTPLLKSPQASILTPENFLVAYEPVWAIGTGKTPTAQEAEETHAFIRGLLPNKAIKILYGGSMNGANAAGFLAEKNIDGGLIGGASLKPEEFRMIVEAAKAMSMV